MSLFPKVLWPFSYLILTQNKPSEFFECYLLFGHFCLTMIDELYVYAPCIPMQIKPNKSLSRQGTGLDLSFPPQDFCSLCLVSSLTPWSLWAGVRITKGHWFNSQSGDTPGLPVRSSVGAT